MIKTNSNSQLNRETKSQLARLMANENLTIEHRAVSTAYFDVEKRLLVLPIWKDMTGHIYDTLVGHEVGHALDTPPSAEVLKNAIESIDAKNLRGAKMYLNVIEDGRIEKLVRRRYPGMRRSFSLGYKELLERNFFGTTGRSIKSYRLIDRINLHLKLGSAMIIDFTPAEKKLVDMVENCETFAEVVNAAQIIYKYSNENKDTNPNENDDFNDFSPKMGYTEDLYPDDDENESYDHDENDNVSNLDELEEDSGSESDQSKSKSKSKSDSDESDSDESKSKSELDQSDSDESDSDESESKSDSKKINESYSNKIESDLNVNTSETQESWESKRENLIKHNVNGYVYYNIPEVDATKWIVPYKQVHEGNSSYTGLSELVLRSGKWNRVPSATKEQAVIETNKFRSENSAIISYMIKEFEMRKAADLFSRSSISKTGVINTNKLHTYKYNDDLFKRITNVPNGKNHGLIMFIDWSGSMVNSISGLIEQLINMVMFCKRVQIPFDVYAFSNLYESGIKSSQKSKQEFSKIMKNQHNYVTGDIIVDPDLKLLQLLSSDMRIGELNKAIGNLLLFRRYFNGHDHSNLYPFNFGSTPLDSTLICATSIVNSFRAKHKLQIVNTVILTDGTSTDRLETFNTPPRLWNQNVVIRDTVSKMENKLEGYEYDERNQKTTVLLNRLRERTNTNVIGYYLHTGLPRVNDFMYQFNFNDPVEIQKANDNFIKNKFIEIANKGYSVYYIIMSDQMTIQNEELNIGKSTSAKSIAKAFAKYTKKRMDNRIVLSRFIEKIS